VGLVAGLVAGPVVAGLAVQTVRLAREVRRAGEGRRVLEQELEAARRETELARRDALTGLVTRAGWMQQAEQLIDNPRAVVLLVDLDHFKAVNDTQGHLAGDRVLCESATRLREWCGPGGVAGRLGGDEFVAVALIEADRVHMHVMALDAMLAAPVTGIGVPVAASIGYVRVCDYPDADLGELLRQADVAMYAVKGSHHARVRSGWGLRRARSVNGRRHGRRGTASRIEVAA
jgi:diguanylate cyclase (GGDEF)-like protein